MKVIFVLALGIALVQGADCYLGQPCAMAATLLAQEDSPPAPSPERSTPPGEWCQRQAAQMDRKAHACACHQHDCQADPNDPNSYSAHTDAHCLNYCHTNNCRCERHDCP